MCPQKLPKEEVRYGPTVNLVSGRNEDTCEIYQEGSWQHLQRTTATRKYQSSGTTEEAVLLIGGYTDDSSDHSEHTTKWIPVDGAAAGHLKSDMDHATVRPN